MSMGTAAFRGALTAGMAAGCYKALKGLIRPLRAGPYKALKGLVQFQARL